MLDLAIIGSGPAALTAAIYMVRAGFNVEVFEKSKIGGALTEISKIENFPGFVGAGQELANNLKKQCEDSGVKISYGEVTEISKNNNFELMIDDEKVEAKTVLVATGSEPIKLDFDAEIPTSYCALCDGPLYAQKNIAVVGGGNSAVQESIYLAKIVKTLTLFAKHDLTAEPHIIQNLKKHNNVSIKHNIEIKKHDIEKFDAVFVFIGRRPATSFLPKEILNKKGYIKTSEYMTKIPGLFAAGDVREDSVKQAITAAGEGAAAAIKITDFLKKG